jgi:hypothetical protein
MEDFGSILEFSRTLLSLLMEKIKRRRTGFFYHCRGCGDCRTRYSSILEVYIYMISWQKLNRNSTCKYCKNSAGN